MLVRGGKNRSLLLLLLTSCALHGYALQLTTFNNTALAQPNLRHVISPSFTFTSLVDTLSCNFSADSNDPLKGPVRAGADIQCSPIDSLDECVGACCANTECQSISWNSPWTLGNHVYMDCEQGKNCCCLKNDITPLEPNKWPMNITTGIVSHSKASCQSDEDCSLNGVCMAGICQCDAEWRGPSCQQLNLIKPNVLTPAYPPPINMTNTSSWGGSVLNVSGTFHMYVAEMLNSCGMRTWSTNSAIRHAVSDSPEGPFEARELVMMPFAHNPTAAQAPDGTYLIYHIGCGTPNQGVEPCTDCIEGRTEIGKCAGPPEQQSCSVNTTNILYSASADGPWQQLNAPFVKSATMGTTFGIDNPTVTFFPNGSLLMLGRGGDPARQASSDGIITANDWRGPYIMHSVVGNSSSPSVEDPFIWKDHRNNFHALFHKFTDETPNCGGHAFSRDGWTWTLTNAAAYITDVTTSDDILHRFQRRERPHLLLDSETGTRPRVLYTTLTNWSISGANKGQDNAFTFAQSIYH